MSTALPRISIQIAPKSQATMPPLWMVKHSAFTGSGVRSNVPAIVNLLAQSMKITREWQFYIRAINHAMELRHVSAIFEYQKAFANGTGFGDAGDPRRDYLLGENMTSKYDPQFDKHRTCIRATHTGEVSGDYLWLESMDGSNPPLLKPGKRQPRTVGEIDIDNYLYNPRDHRWLFFAANNIGSTGNVSAWDHGGFYPWFLDGQRQVTWLPLVGTFPVRIALSLVEVVTEVRSPYSP